MIGSRLGPYEITAKLGEGGMGEVYCATDSRLKREVAIKVLPAAFTEDKERLARFEREAQLLAQLNHPNIAAIHGLEEADGVRALVMELVPGPTLAERLESGAFSFTESLSAALQIAQALEEAHDKGIVHRDLKPQNIKASSEGKIKVLDFGLAKAMDAAAGSAAAAADLARSPTLMNSPTLTAVHGTQLGMILGTAAYMAPEQARGAAVDKRADIWAFGVLLYEMLTGVRLFEGESVVDTLSAVMRQEIDLNRLPAGTPGAIRQLLRRCLERNPKNRLHDIADARIVIEELLVHGDEITPPTAERATRGPRGWRGWLPWTISAVAAVGAFSAVALLGGPERRASAPGEVTRTSILLPSSSTASQGPGTFALAPDGRALVFVAVDEAGRTRLFLRELADAEPRPLDGSEGATFPFWSPDSQHIAFFAGGHLRRVQRAGGSAQTICVAGNGRGGAWSPEGTIVFAPDFHGPLFQVRASGGDPAAATELDTEKAERSHRFPLFLPDGRHFLFGVEPWEENFRMTIKVASLDEPSTGRPLVTAGAMIRFAPPNDLVMPRDEALMVQALDLDRLEMIGEPRQLDDRPLLEGSITSTPVVELSTAPDSDRMLYAPVDPRPTAFVWLGRDGRQLGESRRQEGSFFQATLSHSGDRVAATRIEPGGRRALWVYDLGLGSATRVTAPELIPFGATWSPDDRQIALTVAEGASSSRNAPSLITVESGELRRLREPANRWVVPTSWSTDGRLLVFEELKTGALRDLGFLSLDEPKEQTGYLATASDERGAVISPDGRWVAYMSDSSGKAEVYIDSFPAPSRARRVASGGEPQQVHFRADGRELFVVATESGEAALFACELRPGAEIEIGRPQKLFALPAEWSALTPAPAGDRFLVLKPIGSRPPALMLVDSWRARLAGSR